MYKIKDIKNKILCGDALSELKKIPDESIDMVITSPPYYGLRNYGVEGQIGLEESFEEYLNKIIEIMKEIKRVVKKTGQIWINMGDCYGGTMSWTEEYANKKQWHPRKPIKRLKNFGGNVEKSTITNPEYNQKRGRSGNQKCLLMQPERFAIRCIDEVGLILRNKIKWAKQVLIKKENRTIGSVMPTSVKDRFNESGEELYFFVKSKKYWSDLDAVRMSNQVLGVTDFRASGFVRSAKLYPNSKYAKAENAGNIDGRVKQHIKEYQGKLAGKKDTEVFNSPRARTQRNKVNDPRGNHNGGPGSWRDFKDENLAFTNPKGKNIPTIWQIQSEPHNFKKELGVDIEHFAVFPQKLVEIPIKFGCPKNGIVLDPFMGSGTTAVVSKKLGRNFIGIELNPGYIKLAEKRIKEVQDTLL